MNQTFETPSVPMETGETFFCFCGKEILGEWEDGEFIYDAHVSTDGSDYIHDHCRLAKIHFEMSPEDRIRAARLVAAMSIISEMPKDFLERIESTDFFSFDLVGMKKVVDRQLDDLNDDNATFGTPELVLMRTQDIVKSHAALAGEVAALEQYMRLEPSTGLLLEVRTDRLSYITEARDGCKEAA